MPSSERPDRPRRWWREPLLHFAVLGAGVFALHAWIGPADRGEDRGAIVIADRFVDGLREQHQERTGEEPDAETTEDLVREFVREEALVREARRRGLERGDPIVRRRLLQKMEFLLEGTAEVDEPTDQELRAYLEAHPERFRAAPRIGFTHVFFSRDRREDPRADAREALAALRRKGSSAAPAAEGDPFLLGSEQPPRPLARIAGTFGKEFAEAVRSLPEDAWQGPLESVQGWHLVWVTERTEGGLPALEDVRREVRAAVIEARREQAYREAVEGIVERYEVERRAEEGT